MKARRNRLAWIILLLGLCATSAAPARRTTAADLPARLTDQEFWRLTETMSEVGGTFHSDNFVSNEGRFQTVIPDLVARAKQAGVYLGADSEQNFTHIVAVRPRAAFIIDIRRGNLQEHLLYKALSRVSATVPTFWRGCSPVETSLVSDRA
jgi:hypothetical protein